MSPIHIDLSNLWQSSYLCLYVGFYNYFIFFIKRKLLSELCKILQYKICSWPWDYAGVCSPSPSYSILVFTGSTKNCKYYSRDMRINWIKIATFRYQFEICGTLLGWFSRVRLSVPVTASTYIITRLIY